jgi:hypothetical protein
MLKRPQSAPALEGLNFSFWCVVCFRQCPAAPSLPRPLRFPSRREPWVHPLGFTLIRRLLDGKTQEGALA